MSTPPCGLAPRPQPLPPTQGSASPTVDATVQGGGLGLQLPVTPTLPQPAVAQVQALPTERVKLTSSVSNPRTSVGKRCGDHSPLALRRGSWKYGRSSTSPLSGSVLSRA